MKIKIVFASSFDECGWGYADAFADLGFTALVLGPAHIQFECSFDDGNSCEALQSPWTAFRAWAYQRLNSSHLAALVTRQA